MTPGAQHVCGLHRGVVLAPLADGSLRVTVPSVLGPHPTIATPCLPAASGSGVTPAPGDGVWVAFEQGSPNHPVWMGVWKH